MVRAAKIASTENNLRGRLKLLDVPRDLTSYIINQCCAANHPTRRHLKATNRQKQLPYLYQRSCIMAASMASLRQSVPYIGQLEIKVRARQVDDHRGRPPHPRRMTQNNNSDDFSPEPWPPLNVFCFSSAHKPFWIYIYVSTRCIFLNYVEW